MSSLMADRGESQAVARPQRPKPASAEQRLSLWLMTEAVKMDLGSIVEALGHRLSAFGLPLDRFTVSFSLLNPSLLGGAVIWRPGKPPEFSRYDYARRDLGLYERSPFKVAYETGNWVDIDLRTTPDDAYGIVPDLKAEGIAHYTAVPMKASNGDNFSLTMATKSAHGFSDEQRRLIRDILPALSVVTEIKLLRSTFQEVLAAYVGRASSREIIQGTVHRGQVTKVRAAIFVSDLRGFTHLSTQLPAKATADVINRYYDIVVPAVEKHGGEVLKFIGDAVLAIFPVADRGDSAAVLSALDAAREALDTVIEPFIVDEREIDIRFGIAVHLGNAAYGNVGSGDRLDFTVIGRDVNVAARLASLCSRLGQNYLVSEAVAKVGRENGRLMCEGGAHEVRGLDDPLSVYVPDATDLNPEADDGVSQGITFVSPI
ncbi:adenylate/guanylate cyclase domain-containing protein [Acuticoccus kandeliae]|uniref:adenylate/guanylate cyclase domain-containing protein n=1 Tax=Acuticoccus kandeliae TaxID=2073160 RepID=UPI00196A9028|nr:adenylate/guanylate cyclase domain-containing protein [Acuticoccus kandeliae]